jgi:hypothetical protein
MKFNSRAERDEVIAMSPVAHEGNTLNFERHEEADNRFYTFYRVYAEVAVVDYPWSIGTRTRQERFWRHWAICVAWTRRASTAVTTHPSALCCT